MGSAIRSALSEAAGLLQEVRFRSLPSARLSSTDVLSTPSIPPITTCGSISLHLGPRVSAVLIQNEKAIDPFWFLTTPTHRLIERRGLGRDNTGVACRRPAGHTHTIS